MKITEITIRPTNDGVVGAYVDIVFDNCLMVREIKVIKGPTGLFVSFPSKKQRDGIHRQLAYPANAETRMMIQRAILPEYEKIVERDPVPNGRLAAEGLRALEQLKTDSLINEGEHNSTRKEIVEELLVLPSSSVPERICPKCSSEDVKRASRVGLERLMSLFYIYPFRCQWCWHRFRLFQWGVKYTKIEDQRRYGTGERSRFGS